MRANCFVSFLIPLVLFSLSLLESTEGNLFVGWESIFRCLSVCVFSSHISKRRNCELRVLVKESFYYEK